MKLLRPNPIHYELEANWKYTPSSSTDIRKTFKRIREKLNAERIAMEQKFKPNKVREFKTR